jgi:ArsR family transcriptional regulator
LSKRISSTDCENDRVLGQSAFNGQQRPEEHFLLWEAILGVDISAYADIFILVKTTAQLFKALSDETRLRIMALLLRGQELCVCDIMAALDLPQSTVSRHLSYLRNAGLVDDRRQGIWMHYKVNKESIVHGAPLLDVVAIMLFEQDQSVSDERLLKTHLAMKKKAGCS